MLVFLTCCKGWGVGWRRKRRLPVRVPELRRRNRRGDLPEINFLQELPD